MALFFPDQFCAISQQYATGDDDEHLKQRFSLFIYLSRIFEVENQNPKLPEYRVLPKTTQWARKLKKRLGQKNS